MQTGVIHCGDCLDIMRQMPDNAFDWVITDPPYGIDAPKQHGKRDNMARSAPLAGASDWDGLALTEAAYIEICRISSNQCLFGANYFAALLPSGCGWYVWDKGVPDGFSKSQVEIIYTSKGGTQKIIRHLWHGCMRAGGEGREHPTQKPVGVMRRLVSDLTNDTDTILDPFCGSGSTLVAAEQLGRKWVGIDIDPHWCEVSKRRTAQKGLFSDV